MATELKPMTSEAIALTEKKMNMTLDEIIKESKKASSKSRKTGVPNKNRGFLNGGPFQGNAAKVQQFMDARSSLRQMVGPRMSSSVALAPQGVLAQRRSTFTGNQFPLTPEIANKAAVSPIHNRAVTCFRVGTWNKPRVPSIPVNRDAAPEDAFTGGQAKDVPKQRPQTMDSLFAVMKEQRMKALSRQRPSNQSRGANVALGNKFAE